MKQVLVWGDTPTCATGFGTVVRNVLKRLSKTGEYMFTIVGINYDGSPYDHREFPYMIYPAMAMLSNDERYRSPYGHMRFVDMAATGKYDIIFIVNDTFLVGKVIPKLIEARDSLPIEKKFSIVYYFPIDGVPKSEWIEQSTLKADFPVTYTRYAKGEVEKAVGPLERLRVVYHGVDKSIFQQVDVSDFKKTFLQKHDSKFIVLNVNRNQPRKDLHRTFASFKILHDRHKDTFLFLLCQMDDVGGNLIEMGERYGLRFGEDWAGPPPSMFSANSGYPIEIVNKIYNMSDLVVSSTTGEGWGLSSVEAMACKVPVLFPRNTSLTEIIGENEERGYLCKSGEDANFFINMGKFDNNVLRPVIDVKDMAEKMEYVYLHRDEAKAKAERAYSEVWEWDTVCEEWKKIFKQADVWKNYLRSGVVAGRNDPCPCGSGRKLKHCHY